MAIALVNNVKARGVNNTTSGAVDMTGADFLYLNVGWEDVGSAPTISDSLGNVWNALTKRTGIFCSVQPYYAANPTVGAAQTFTMTGSGLFMNMEVTGWSGSDTSSPFDQQNGAGTLIGNETSLATGSITPSVNNCLVIAALAIDGGGTSINVNGGFAISDSYDFGTTTGGAQAYLVQTSAAAANPTFSWTTAAGSGAAAAIASFKPAAAAATHADQLVNSGLVSTGTLRGGLVR